MDVVQPAVVVNGNAPQSAPKASPVGSSEISATWRDRVEYAGLRVGLGVARCMPVSWVTGIGAFLASTAGPWLRQNQRALENLAIAFPDKTPAERAVIARAMWANMGRIFAETLVLDRVLADPDAIEIVDHAYWQARMTEPGPSIGCTLHMGNWELAIWPLTLFGRRPAGVYRPIANPLVDAWLARTRAVLYPGGLLGKGESEDDAKSGQRTARLLIDHARKGGCIGFVCDHFDRRGTPIRFMGRFARFTTAPAMIARHLGARLWVGRCLRIGTTSRFRMEIKELDLPRTADKAGDARHLTTAVFAAFEAWIRENPEQWMWWNTRWIRHDEVQVVDVKAPAP
jgi:KDO2-lipid IV(A) lauroyltransferase